MTGSIVPAMKTRPPAVTIGPPKLGEPGGTGVACATPKFCIEPSGTCQRVDEKQVALRIEGVTAPDCAAEVSGICQRILQRGRGEDSVISHAGKRILPSTISTAVNAPHGGGLHGR